MRAIQTSGRGLWYLISLNGDRLMYIGAISGALMLSAFLTAN